MTTSTILLPGIVAAVATLGCAASSDGDASTDNSDEAATIRCGTKGSGLPPVRATIPFGGEQVIRANESGVVIDESANEYLLATVSVNGQASFTFVREDGVVLQDSMLLEPDDRYQWELAVANGALQRRDLAYTLGIAFATAPSYSYQLEHCDATDSRIQILKDVDYQSDNKDNFYFETILVGVE